MNASARIYGVTVNHKTSQFVELMLRTLLLTNALAGREMQPPSFIESEWVRQQRQQPRGGEYEPSN